MSALMTRDFIENILGVKATAAFSSITGVSIDTRTLEQGNLFVALSGEQQDGHAFVETAFSKGAAAALVLKKNLTSLSAYGPLIPVDDCLSALVNLGVAARARLSSRARVIAITGSVGKTGTKEALRLVLSKQGNTHASVASYNNHFGVPLTLARMSEAIDYGIFEIGMNHAGEIEPLTRQVRPHVALITTVEAVHIENFPNVEAIADEKSALFLGLEDGGTAIINRDNPHYERMWTQASRSRAGRVLSFGENPFADIRLAGLKSDAEGSDIIAEINGVALSYRLGSPGKHLALNSLGVLAACLAVGADIEAAAHALADVKPPQGRGSRLSWGAGDRRITLIDESYNANPTSMRAAFALLAQTKIGERGRRIAIIGDMLELGRDAEAMHAGLAASIEDYNIDRVYACGPLMHALFDALPKTKQGGWFEHSRLLAASLSDAIHAGDAVMIKGSNGSRMREVVDALKNRFDKDKV
ncbi:MAG: UDP-N-acetylmuramoylalanyl-D-glutamyl-2,6-diaminopimelate--D-alanyl-D-alanine ligase [Alphaproteobacteria bacterium]|nr:UDP-N-acetylmuramoylalanyl-D-glutamyl-2,6-diaminopimelate--D-alanyl-D-alanine ligase [Alphaproteobacteria bacterium]